MNCVHRGILLDLSGRRGSTRRSPSPVANHVGDPATKYQPRDGRVQHVQQQQTSKAVCNPSETRHLITPPGLVQGNHDASAGDERLATR